MKRQALDRPGGQAVPGGDPEMATRTSGGAR